MICVSEEIVVDLAGGEITPQVLSQLQQTHKIVGLGSYQYGESEQPARAVIKGGTVRFLHNINTISIIVVYWGIMIKYRVGNSNAQHFKIN